MKGDDGAQRWPVTQHPPRAGPGTDRRNDRRADSLLVGVREDLRVQASASGARTLTVMFDHAGTRTPVAARLIVTGTAKQARPGSGGLLGCENVGEFDGDARRDERQFT